MQLSSEGFWAVTKHKMKIHRAPGLYETVSAETWPEKPGPVRGGRNFLIKDSGGNVIVESRSEWVILDMADHHIRKMSDTIYPITDEHIDKRLLPDPFLRIKETVCPDDYVYTHIVRPSDIDLSQHTNNAVYVRLFEDCFPLSFFEENRVGQISARGRLSADWQHHQAGWPGFPCRSCQLHVQIRQLAGHGLD